MLLVLNFTLGTMFLNQKLSTDCVNKIASTCGETPVFPVYIGFYISLSLLLMMYHFKPITHYNLQKCLINIFLCFHKLPKLSSIYVVQ